MRVILKGKKLATNNQHVNVNTLDYQNIRPFVCIA